MHVLGRADVISGNHRGEQRAVLGADRGADLRARLPRIARREPALEALLASVR